MYITVLERLWHFAGFSMREPKPIGKTSRVNYNNK